MLGGGGCEEFSPVHTQPVYFFIIVIFVNKAGFTWFPLIAIVNLQQEQSDSALVINQGVMVNGKKLSPNPFSVG